MSSRPESPGSPSLGSSKLSLPKLVEWFPDPGQKSSIILKWIKVTTALSEIQDQPAASKMWQTSCTEMGGLREAANYDVVCAVLDGLSATFQRMQSETNGAWNEKKRPILERAALAPRQQKRSRASTGDAASSAEACLQTVSNPAERPILERAALAPRQHKRSRASTGDAASSAEACLQTVSNPAEPGSETCPDTCSSGLSHARQNKGTVTTVTSPEILLRRFQFRTHLMQIAMEFGGPISVKKLYDSFRSFVGLELSTMQLRPLIQNLCNNTRSVEYLIVTNSSEEAVQSFTPTDKKRRNQPKQVLAGKVPFDGRTLCFYKNCVERGYQTGPRPRKGEKNDPFQRGACEVEFEHELEGRPYQLLDEFGSAAGLIHGSLSFGTAGPALSNLPDDGNSRDSSLSLFFRSEILPADNSNMAASSEVQENASPAGKGISISSLITPENVPEERITAAGGAEVGSDRRGEGGEGDEAEDGSEDGSDGGGSGGEGGALENGGDGEGGGGDGGVGAEAQGSGSNEGEEGGDGRNFGQPETIGESGAEGLERAVFNLAELSQLAHGSEDGSDGGGSGIEGCAFENGEDGEGGGGTFGESGVKGLDCAVHNLTVLSQVTLAAHLANQNCNEQEHNEKWFAQLTQQKEEKGDDAWEEKGDDAMESAGCSVCSRKSEVNLRICPKCSSPVCCACASISDGLLIAIQPFLKKDPCAAWKELQCVKCQPVEAYDKCLSECLEDVRVATDNSLKGRARHSRLQKTLWFHFGLLLCEGGPLSGYFVSDDFRGLAEKLTILEGKINSESSIAPWDAEVVGLSPNTVSAAARSHARKYNLKKSENLNENMEGLRKILAVSADYGNHSTAHLMAGELKEMGQSQRAEVWVMCVARKDRLEALDSTSSTYRADLKRVFGARFLEVGHLPDADITQRINDLGPQIIYLAGFHQDGDRIAIFDGVTGHVMVQGVAHASTTGSRGVDFLLCNRQVLPEELAKHYTEMPLYIDGPFLPNSFSTFFADKACELSQLRNNKDIRLKEREKLGMPTCKIIANISQPNRLDKSFTDMAIGILKANADAVLVLIDHGYPAFKLRIEERFKEQGLQGKIMFMQYQQLYNGDLHKFLALIDVNLDTVVYNGHTASHDVLWANGVLISVRGKSLASRVGADLLHHFGTPENICDDPAAAVARVNQLLQNPTCLSEAVVKADQCRASSKMYDNSHRAEIVIEALLRAFDDKLAASRQRNQLACSASASQQLLASDMQSLCSIMEGLGIAVTGNPERSNRFFMLDATFRGVSVVVKISNDLDVQPEDNSAFREVLFRDGKFCEFGQQLTTQLLPFVENRASEEGHVELDVIQFSCRGKQAFAVIEEKQEHRAEVLFDALSERWRAKPDEETVARTARLLLALINVVECLHSRGKANAGDPRAWKLSLLKDGHGKSAVAYVEHRGQVYSLLLGCAESVMDPFIPSTISNQMHLIADRGRRRAGSNRSREVLCNSQIATTVRSSLRKIGSNASIPASQIRSMLIGPDNLIGCHSIIEKARRDDLRKAAMAVLNAILGRTGQETAVEGECQEACHLFRGWLGTLSDEEFRNATGEIDRNIANDRFCKKMMKKTSQLQALMELLARMLGAAELDAKDILESTPFPDMSVTVNAYPAGLDSAPEAVRAHLQTCPQLMTQISLRVVHYYVPGKTLYWTPVGGPSLNKKLIPTWLVYKWEEAKQRYNRSVWTAAEGNDGDFGAIYHSPVCQDETLLTHRNPLHFMAFPCCNSVMDGRPRASDDTPRSVANSEVGQYVNSSLDENSIQYRVPNCAREWNYDWHRLDTLDVLGGNVHDVSMALKLTRNVPMYHELHYVYTWGKHERKTHERKTNHLQQLTKARHGDVQRVRMKVT